MALAIMTVCTGNMCRSPLAERLLVKRCHEAGVDAVVDSAGTRAANGGAIHSETLRVLESYGGDATGFASRLISPTILRGHDLVLTASRRHRSAVQELAPLLWKKTYTLLEVATLAEANPDLTLAGLSRARMTIDIDAPSLDIEDPIGKDVDVFERTGKEISDAIDSIVRLLSRS